MNFQNKNGEAILLGDVADFKVDTNRRVYVKAKESTRFQYIDYQIPVGYSTLQKKQHLEMLHNKVAERMGLDGENNNEMDQ